MNKDSSPVKKLHIALLPILGLAAAFSLTGCGGGGGSSPTPASNATGISTSASTATVNGLLQTPSGTVLAGYPAVYDAGLVTDANATLTVTTSASGTYSLSIPAHDITGSDRLTFYDTLGGAAATQAVTPAPGQTVSVTTTVIVTSPPTHP